MAINNPSGIGNTGISAGVDCPPSPKGVGSGEICDGFATTNGGEWQVGSPTGIGTLGICDGLIICSLPPLTSEVWTVRTTPLGFWFDIAWSPTANLFASVSEDVTGQDVMTSPDGINWTLRTTPTFSGPAGFWAAICWSPAINKFVAVGEDNNGPIVGTIMTSPDGINWSLQTIPVNMTAGTDVASSNSLIVAIGASSTVGVQTAAFTSTNGTAWVEHILSATQNFVGIVWDGSVNLFCAFSNDGSTQAVATSPDGVTWTSQTTPNANTQQWVNGAWSSTLGTVCAVSFVNSGMDAMISSNLASWTAHSTPQSGQQWNDVIYGNGVFAAVSVGRTGMDAMRSRDGITWVVDTTPNTSSQPWWAVAYSPSLNLFCAVSDSGFGDDAMTLVG